MRSVALSEWLRPWGHVGVTAFLAEYPVDMTQLAPEYLPVQGGHTGGISPMSGAALGGSRLAGAGSQSATVSGAAGSGATAEASASSLPRDSSRLSAGSSEDSENIISARITTERATREPAARELTTRELATTEHNKTGQASSGQMPSGRMGSAPAPSGSPRSYSSHSEQATQGRKSPIQVPLPEALAREDWPDAFQTYFQRLSPAPVVWCYEALGEDLFGSANPQRSDCLKRLIGDLQFPKGTSVFWPPSIPEVLDVALSQRVLLQALQELFPKLVISVGSGPVLSLLYGSEAPLPFTQRLLKGHMVVFLPDFLDLAENTSLFTQSVLYLRAIVSQLFII